MTKPVQHIAEQRALGLKIEAVQRIVVEKSSADGCGRFEQWRRMAAIERLEIGSERLWRFAARSSSGPIAHESPENRGAATSRYRLCKHLGIHSFALLRLLSI